MFTLPDTDTDAETDTDAIGFETHCVGVGTSVGKGKICVGVGQCEHTITTRNVQLNLGNNVQVTIGMFALLYNINYVYTSTLLIMNSWMTRYLMVRLYFGKTWK